MLNREQEDTLRRELCGEGSAETYSHNWLIEAGAGAGKTYTMVNRIVNQLVRGLLQPEQLAAITFTEKATREMLSRIDEEFRSRLKAAEAANDTAGAELLRSLAGSVDRMQISTIHAFCHRMLMTMPYESALGPDFELLEKTDPYAAVFYDRSVAENPSLFREARELVGIPDADLRYNFQSLCESGAELAAAEASEVSAIHQRLERAAGQVYEYLTAGGASWSKVTKPESDKVQSVAVQLQKLDRLLKGPKEAFTRYLTDALNPFSSESTVKDETLARLLGKGFTKTKLEIAVWTEQIKEGWSQLAFAVTIPDLQALISAYRRDKLANHVASQNDLLLYARDMLRQSPEARAYFHNRYRTVYVDEMQDTDPVQAQLLFYLTCDEESFCAEDWRRCKPVPGSLFLVGDPKQAIYRFRGGDITVYKLLSELFERGVGKVCSLRQNYRSSTEICAFVDRAFEDRLIGGTYQADYLSMDAVNGSASQARIVRYSTAGKGDAEQVADFIAEMLRSKTLVGMGERQHEVRCEDFLVLTRKNAGTAYYVRALAQRGIPCSMAGSRKLSEVKPVARGAVVLQYLADREDATKRVAALYQGLGVPLPLLRIYRSLAEKQKTEQPDLTVEQQDALAPLLQALGTLQHLSESAETNAPVAVLEQLLFSVPAIWRDIAPNRLSGDYAMVSQYLNLLRKETPMPFPLLAERAAALAESEVERELLPEETTDCVRVMNLHKAKGLEAEIVLLVDGSQSEKRQKRRPLEGKRHVAAEGNSARLYTCFIHNGHIPNRNGEALKPSGWEDMDGPGTIEKEFLEAEEVRLQYVAATRPKTALLINTCPGWDLLEPSDSPEDLPEAAPEAAVSLYNDRDPNWQRAIRILRSEEQRDGETASAGTAVLAAEPAVSLPERVAALAQTSEIRISPSKLETHERLPLPEQEEPFPVREAAPHGAYWGTVVHRLLELLIRSGSYTSETIVRYARFAAAETLSEEELPGEALAMLLEGHILQPGETLISYVAARAAQTAAFLADPANPLRALLDSSTAYPELPFALQLTDPAAPLAQKVYELVGEGEKPIYMNGIIDLALHDGQAWTLVDYKTDILLPGENKAEFIARLKQSYSPQLRAYREILTGLRRGPVAHTYLCALSLSAELIEL